MYNFSIVLVLVLARALTAISDDDDDDKIELHVLNILPFQDDRPNAGWDRGVELAPAGELAVEQINNRSDLLAGYRLELITVDSEACGISVINKGLVNTYGKLADRNIVVVGVVGLFCSSVTSVLAPIINFTIFDRVMVAGSTSPVHRNPALYPRLYHTISSATVFSNAMIRMMTEFDWQRVSIVHDSEGVVFTTSSAYFVNQINSSPNFTLSQSVQILPSLVSGAIPQLIYENTRIIFAVVSVPEAANLMCEAYRMDSLWPAYVYIFQERIMSDFLDSITSCKREEMMRAIEGIFLLNYKLETDPQTELISGVSYADYYKKYLQRLSEVEKQYNTTLDPNNTYANVAYDAIWTLALALNGTSTVLRTTGTQFEDYRHNPAELSDIIQTQIMNTAFQGAAGVVNFTGAQETVSSIIIHQVRNGTANTIGFYNPQITDAITIVSEVDDLPSDRFNVVNRYFPVWLTAVTILFSIACYVFTTCLLVAYFHYRKKAEIKASSPYLSVLLFIGCYMLYTAVLSQTIVGGYKINGFVFLCNVEAWCIFCGLNLIYGTLFVRLLRIKYVFKQFRKTSKYWSSKFLFFGVLAIVAMGSITLVVWTAYDTLHKASTETYIPGARLPYFEVNYFCSSEHIVVWEILNYAYSLLLLISTVYLAIQTRHIKHTNFKDTKKVNGYAFSSAFVLLLGISLALVIRFGVGSDIGEHILSSVSLLLVGVLCQCFLITPKVFPFLYRKCNSSAIITHTPFSSLFIYVNDAIGEHNF